jgi:peptide/nickel transport system permease protein
MNLTSKRRFVDKLLQLLGSKLVKNIAYLIGMLFLISVISFAAIHAAPDSFIPAGGLNPKMTQENIAALKAIYGLDKSLIEQYFVWMQNLLTLNFGVSFTTGEPVLQEIQSRVGITLFISLFTLIVVFITSLYLGVKAGLSPHSRFDKAVKQLSLLSFSMPSFYLAILLILVFSVWFEWFPLTGLHSTGVNEESFLSYYWDMLWHLVLPLTVIIFVSIGSMTMYVRSLVIEIMKSDYITFAEARNLEKRVIVRYYVLPNLVPPIVTLLGLSLPGLMGGSVILEQIFSIDGMGQLFYFSALSHDYPVIMGLLMITAFLTLLGNMIADTILLKLNPFFKRSHA